MDHGLDEIASPTGEIVRVGSHHGPCEPPPWSRATSDGSFGNRFDDPRAADGRPLEECFRCLYLGDTIDAAFGEVLAGFQPPLPYLAGLAAIEDDEPLEDVLATILHIEPSTGKVRGIIPADWRSAHRICRIVLDADLRFADLTTMRSRLYLRRELAAVALELGLDDLDFSVMLSPAHRRLTQRCAARIHQLRNQDGSPRFAGIHYLSRHNVAEWRCWALFDDRVRGKYRPGAISPITADDEALVRVAGQFDLAIQTVAGRDHYSW